LPRAVIVDYGIGNLFSLRCALDKVGFDSVIRTSPLQLKDADLVVLPGVGSFPAASRNLSSLRDEILTQVRDGMPLLGICLGMQLLFCKSEEGEGRGLELLQGKNERLPGSVKVPQMGWNTLEILRPSRILENIEDGSYMYFVHSYHSVPLDNDVIVAETTYGTAFPSAVEKQNVYGTQFHPEKSGQSGLKILSNLFEITRR
jgi:glutamine amidotransferase